MESDFLLFFECSEEVMEERLLKRSKTSGRADDNIETIKKRFGTFVEKTLPVIDYYGQHNKVKKVSRSFLWSCSHRELTSCKSYCFKMSVGLILLFVVSPKVSSHV